MFDDGAVGEVVAELDGLVGRLAGLPPAVDDAERVDRIAALERLKAAVYAAQLCEVAQFACSQEVANRAAGVAAGRAGRGVAEQVGWARKVSPAAGARQVGQARALIGQLPATFDLLRRGEVSEHVAGIVATETSHLADDDRRLVDKLLAADLPQLSPRRAEALARRLTIEADPPGAVARAGRARADRRVWLRPAPETMAVLSAVVPCEQGVAAWAALHRHAGTLIAAADGRTRGQIMADTLVERLTGQASAAAVPAEIGLVMTDTSLLAGEHTAADLTGYGPIPADLARHIAGGGDPPPTGPERHTSEPTHQRPARSGTPANLPPPPTRGRSASTRAARVFLRRLFTDPTTGIITNLDRRRRRFDGTLATLLVYRDRTCRDPFCQAPIRHLDHTRAHTAGGPTTPANGRGLCERGNYTAQMPGFTTRLLDPRRHILETITPTGHTYRSRPPPAPGAVAVDRPP